MARVKLEDFRVRYGPWALVAGASEGLGAEFAAQLAARGLNLVLIARRAEALEEVSAQLRREYAVEVRVLALDLARADLAAAVSETTDDLEIGLLVYNAALSKIGPYFETALDDHLRELDINCRAPMTLAYLLGQPMLKRGRGGILLMSSLGGAQGSALLVNYTATKAYNRLLAEGLWDELRARGVDVLTCCPPAVSTPGYLASAPKGSMSALTPQAVASSALAALGHGPTIIPGWSYRLANFLMQRVLPRKTT
ncbi:MAG TPA: SDR family NAD(P)-dependent oxidoreductase, partial [Ktedonobacteraceae bacterium]